MLHKTIGYCEMSYLDKAMVAATANVTTITELLTKSKIIDVARMDKYAKNLSYENKCLLDVTFNLGIKFLDRRTHIKVLAWDVVCQMVLDDLGVISLDKDKFLPAQGKTDTVADFERMLNIARARCVRYKLAIENKLSIWKQWTQIYDRMVVEGNAKTLSYADHYLRSLFTKIAACDELETNTAHKLQQYITTQDLLTLTMRPNPSVKNDVLDAQLIKTMHQAVANFVQKDIYSVCTLVKGTDVNKNAYIGRLLPKSAAVYAAAVDKMGETSLKFREAITSLGEVFESMRTIENFVDYIYYNLGRGVPSSTTVSYGNLYNIFGDVSEDVNTAITEDCEPELNNEQIEYYVKVKEPVEKRVNTIDDMALVIFNRTSNTLHSYEVVQSPPWDEYVAKGNLDNEMEIKNFKFSLFIDINRSITEVQVSIPVSLLFNQMVECLYKPVGLKEFPVSTKSISAVKGADAIIAKVMSALSGKYPANTLERNRSVIEWQIRVGIIESLGGQTITPEQKAFEFCSQRGLYSSYDALIAKFKESTLLSLTDDKKDENTKAKGV